MKKIIYILILLSFFGCNDFLDEVDQDKLVPEKTEHYAALLLKEFNADYALFRTVDYMTDNMVEDNRALSSSKKENKTTYTWQREIEIDEEGNELRYINNAWKNMYQDIAVANYVLESIEEATGELEEIEYIKGEAHFVRALSYFNLLNLYGQPYDPATADSELGVPVRKNIGVEVSYNRNTVADCYAFIETEIMEARMLIEGSNLVKTKWHPTTTACDLLMSRVKLYQQKWDEAINYANDVIQVASLSKMYSDREFVTAENREILYSYYTVSPIMKLYDNSTTLKTTSFRANKELINLYDDNDNRKELFFAGIDDGTGKLYFLTKKYETGLFTSMGFANLRVGEAYLNRAEAYAQKGDVTNAMDDIKTLHASRYSDTSSVVYPTGTEEALKFILEDRRKELCFEDHHRWFDLRRMDNRPEIKHVYTLIGDDGAMIGTETYTLLTDDLNYSLPIPLKERQSNSLIRNNERYEKIPEIDSEIIIP